jgi:hypothetical protein
VTLVHAEGDDEEFWLCYGCLHERQMRAADAVMIGDGPS